MRTFCLKTTPLTLRNKLTFWSSRANANFTEQSTLRKFPSYWALKTQKVDVKTSTDIFQTKDLMLKLIARSLLALSRKILILRRSYIKEHLRCSKRRQIWTNSIKVTRVKCQVEVENRKIEILSTKPKVQ